MDLQPREMSGGTYRGGQGFYPERLSNFSLCIRCGDCVLACEGTTSGRSDDTPLRMGFLPQDARDSRDGTAPPVEPGAKPGASVPEAESKGAAEPAA